MRRSQQCENSKKEEEIQVTGYVLVIKKKGKKELKKDLPIVN